MDIVKPRENSRASMTIIASTACHTAVNGGGLGFAKTVSSCSCAFSGSIADWSGEFSVAEVAEVLSGLGIWLHPILTERSICPSP